MTFDKKLGERDILYWRLRKIADANPLYRESIHNIIDSIRLDANDAVHNSSVCLGGRAGTYDGDAIMAIRHPFERLHALVVKLITSTMSDIFVVYSHEARWRPASPTS